MRDPQVKDLWVIIPFLDCWALTDNALRDALLQEGVNPRVLLIDNGGSAYTRKRADEAAAGAEQGKVLVWHHKPELPSLAATWNAALDFVWAAGGKRAWVMNNDVRLHLRTASTLWWCLNQTEALFISAVGVTPKQFDAPIPGAAEILETRGGPDFSCFIITKECHAKYRFDEAFIPAYCEDLDMHRRMMLGGDGRRIFSVNVPYLHVDNGSGTLKAMDTETRARKEEQINRGSRVYYAQKWGGPVNQETFYGPFGAHQGSEAQAWHGPTTPELQQDVWREKADR